MADTPEAPSGKDEAQPPPPKSGAAAEHNKHEVHGKYLYLLSLTALGVVYGDIGTSPLYALRECFFGDYAMAVTPANVLGVLSLIFWSLVLVISFKYLVFIMRADNEGEGGILALMALARPEGAGKATWIIVALGLFGAALLYGDGVITPAISVLSAVEGLEVATPALVTYVIPITIVILVFLFMVQRHGTARVGSIFGPITAVWFLTLAVLGISGIVQEPHVLLALSPHYAVEYFMAHGLGGIFVLGAVFLVVTGGEALYADMGHFGARPIRLAWFSVVLPSLLLNYLGQGALLLRNPEAAHNPFFRLAPHWSLYPLVALATVATVIASQAVITGAFSLTMQGVQLGYFPRVQIDHTSAKERGQIYIPLINWILMITTIALVLGFKRSTNLAAAYGVAVTTTMVITTVLFYVVSRRIWGWSRWLSAPLCLFFLTFDLAFFGANIIKIPAGGWFPLAVALLVFTVMATWKRGREILANRLRATTASVDGFLAGIVENPPQRVSGVAVFMTGNPQGVPGALLHNLKHNKVMHERVILLTVVTEEIPHVPAKRRVQFETLGAEMYRVVVHNGFMDEPSIPEVLEYLARTHDFKATLQNTTFFLSRETLIATKRPGMAVWRERLFVFMSRNAQSATRFFNIPPNRVVEVGTQINL